MNKAGFSLVELSIVLVILGLLVGGVLGGQALIRAAELRAIPVEIEAYHTARNAFRDKYHALPGDMPNATRFWGRADNGTFSGQCANPTTDVGTGTQTCNGDGSQRIGGNEQFRLWQHLSNAGLLAGQFSGVADVTPMKIGHNAPQMRIPNITMRVLGNVSYYQKARPETLRLGLPSSTQGNDGAFLSPEEAWNIDTKMDDGRPDQGKLLASCGNQPAYWASPECLACVTQHWGLYTNADYILTDKQPSCVLAFVVE